MRRIALLTAALLTGGYMSAQAAKTAVLETSKGTITIQFVDDAPNTVANFIGLANGTKEYTDPKTGAKTKGKYYDGLIFHRVIPKFMIQGGDPLGTGTGDPGYKFADEFPSEKFDRVGRVAMANAGPNTNGSQFFITVDEASFLNNGHYTIFGQVTSGQDVANAISNVPRNSNDRPNDPVIIKHVTIK